jgi:putative glutamine amidotransferase
VSYRPLIAVVSYHLDARRVSRWPDGGYGVPAPYIDALARAGARVAIVPPTAIDDPAEILEPFDGLLLAGGGDIDPTRYGAKPDTEHNYGAEPDRDAFEIALLHEADHRHMPTLCICRGMQVMNVAFGGTLHQHLPDIDGLLEHGVPLEGTETTHDVVPEPGTRLSATTKAGPLSCASHHHQGVDRVGDGLTVTGRSPDGLIEAIELVVADPDDEWETWMLGVQWHPEETAAVDRAQQSLFDALALIARLHGSRARPGQSQGRTRDFGIAEPDPGWPARFEAEARRIRQALGDTAVRIDHVGSTSVPGLPAKPVIDVQVSVASMTPRGTYVDPLVAAGYVWTVDPWDDTHEFFSTAEDAEGHRSAHIHVCAAGSVWERRHLAFRDWLRAHPDDAAAYSALKRQLAADHRRDVHTYTHGKGAFVRSIEAKALAEMAAADTKGLDRSPGLQA